jgi:Druantia protein DruA
MNKKVKKTIRISAREANLKRRLRRHLSMVGFTKAPDGSLEISGSGKDVIRSLHLAQRNALLRGNRKLISEQLPALIQHFASGTDIEPRYVTPVLERVRSDTWQSDLFRLASLTWTVPVSHGFGRRLRYLVWDEYNEKLIGLIAIGDPVFNLSVRDTLIGWDSHDRSDRLVNIMDAYVLGAVPPYNMLLVTQAKPLGPSQVAEVPTWAMSARTQVAYECGPRSAYPSTCPRSIRTRACAHKPIAKC